MKRVRFAKIAYIAALLCLAHVDAAMAQTFTVVANLPVSLRYLTQLVQGQDGYLLGNNQSGGVYGLGDVIRTSLDGQMNVLYTFCSKTNCADGEFPVGLYQAPNGKIYGNAANGGTKGKGAIYQLSPGNKENILYSFCSQTNCNDGFDPESAPVPSVTGGLLGTTTNGGHSNGTLFELTQTGQFNLLYTFCAQAFCTDGARPFTSPFQTADGTIYGTTARGGLYGGGTFYAFTPQGQLVTLYSFRLVDGAAVGPQVIQAADGNFYGITFRGGQSGNGTFFRITSQGELTTLYSFCTTKLPCPDGAGPTSIIQGSDGNFYGVTALNGPFGGGTLFEVTPQGTETTLHTFCEESQCLDGDGPQALVQHTNGTFYGATQVGGTRGGGTAFSVSVGLGPFVKANPGFGKVGAEIAILGGSLTGTTSVTFNGTAATFTVESDTLIKATVPNDVTSGRIEVMAPGGSLTSNFSFQVLR